jgi:hypothetical protein
VLWATAVAAGPVLADRHGLIIALVARPEANRPPRLPIR